MLVPVLLSGCQITVEHLKTVSAGYVGCPASQIRITNRARPGVVGTSETWNATCNGKVYLCSGVDATGQYSCAPAAQ
jgi:hypothetical protein